MELLYALLSVVLVSIVSVIAAIPLLMKKKVANSVLLALLGLSVGTLMGGSFLHLLPESIEEGFTIASSMAILVGFLVLFFVEKIIHFRHKHGLGHAHSHAYQLGPLNIMGDAVHNFIDGLVIGGAYLINIPLGIATTIAVIFHELPQEIADFGILLYAGYSKKKALIFNFLSALTSIIGVVIAFYLYNSISTFTQLLLPFAIGNFIYIAASNLIPELNRSHEFKQSLIQTIMIFFGIFLMWLLLFYGG